MGLFSFFMSNSDFSPYLRVKGGFRRAADELHQLERVLQRAAACAHAGHGDADQPFHGIARAAERVGGGQQGEGQKRSAGWHSGSI